MNTILDPNSALQGYSQPGTSWTNEMHFVTNHVPGAGSPVRPVDLSVKLLIPTFTREKALVRVYSLLIPVLFLKQESTLLRYASTIS